MRRILVILVVLVLAASCSAGPPVRFYTLAPPPPATGEVGSGRVGVLPFAVEAPYDSTRLVYRTSPGSPRVDFYAYHQWAAPVGEEVASLVAAELSTRLSGHLVEVAFSGRVYAAYVHGRLLRLEEVDRPGGVETHATLEIELRSPDGTVWSVERVEGHEEAAAASSVEEVVRMMQESVSGAVASAVPGLAKSLDERLANAPGDDG